MTIFSPPADRMQLTAKVKAAARAAGFDLVGVAAMGPATHGDEFRAWLAAGRNKPNEALEVGVDVRTDPRLRRNLIVERCLSARSISIEGPVPIQYLDSQPGHLSGCDTCQEVCPYNRRRGSPAGVIVEPPEDGGR